MTGMQFQYCHSSRPNDLVTVTIDEDSDLEDVAKAFENFLRACGYTVEEVEIR